MIRGIDISSFQPKPRWDEVVAAGAEFVIVKVTEGNRYTNPYAQAQVRGAMAAGLLVMGYHFARPDGPDWIADARDEARRLDVMADSFEQKRGQPFYVFLDVERNEPLGALEIPNWRAWVNEFKRWSSEIGGRGIGFYSYGPFAEALSLEPSWTNSVLWLARYPRVWHKDPNVYHAWPAAPKPWPRPDIWQDGGNSNGAVWPGIDGPCDVDCFAGSLQELKDLCVVSDMSERHVQ